MTPVVDNIMKVLDNSNNIEEALVNIEKATLNTNNLEKSLLKSAWKEFIKIFKKK